MIQKGEIDIKANKEGVRATQVQKDYAISWVLWGISKNAFLKQSLAFKGGTCLKKVYFDDYRYSEDLDFTVLNDDISDKEILKNFKALFSEVNKESRIKMSIDDETFEIHESGSIKLFIDFTGPHGSDRIKVDITRGEKLNFDVGEKTIFKNYSDLVEAEDLTVQCYALEEILIEKMAALMGRTIPRDLYDFNYLLSDGGLNVDDVYIEFLSKAKNKNHNPKEFHSKVASKKSTFERDWKNSLEKQMAKDQLPHFDEVWRNSGRHFKEVDKKVNQ